MWILLKQETVSGSGISWAICKSASSSRQITTPAPHYSVFTGQMPFLPPNQQCQSTEGLLHSGQFHINSCSLTKIQTQNASMLVETVTCITGYMSINSASNCLRRSTSCAPVLINSSLPTQYKIHDFSASYHLHHMNVSHKRKYRNAFMTQLLKTLKDK